MEIQGSLRLLSVFAAVMGFTCSGPALENTKRPPIVGVAHIGFEVSDLARARAFYGEFLGFEEPFQVYKDDGNLLLTYFKVNDRQYIEIFPGLPAEKEDRLSHIALETTDIETLRIYLKEKGVQVPDKVNQGRDGNLNMTVEDPDGHRVEFVQYRAASLHDRARGRYVSESRISERMLHVGVTVADAASADAFYRDVLGFSEIWRGGTTDSVTSWINMKVPDGTDYIEYMLVTGKVDRRRLGVLHHLALQVPDIQKALETLRGRVTADHPFAIAPPQIGRNNRWQLNLYDPDGSRTELMEPYTAR